MQSSRAISQGCNAENLAQHRNRKEQDFVRSLMERIFTVDVLWPTSCAQTHKYGLPPENISPNPKSGLKPKLGVTYYSLRKNMSIRVS